MNIAMPAFRPRAGFTQGNTDAYILLPFRFARLPKAKRGILITSDTGEYAFLSEDEFQDYVSKRLVPSSLTYLDLRARSFLIEPDEDMHLETMAAKLRTRKSFVSQGPALHIFVITLRCDTACQYCQVSRQNPNAAGFDMSPDNIKHAVNRLFESPSSALTVEFQGGESALNFVGIQQAVNLIEERNALECREISFVIASTLHNLTTEMLEFCRDHNILLSTSLDGPASLHNANRPNPKKDSYESTAEAIRRARNVVGPGAISALLTITRRSLEHPEAIIDCYVENGFRSIFLRPLSPYGFARRTEAAIGYPMADFIVFYKRALDYLIKINLSGTPIDEAYTTILLNHILTPFPTGYVNLRSPVGDGFGVLVYNYDGKVYSSDEGRMLAESGDFRFRLGDVSQSYRELMTSEAMQWVIAAGVGESNPGCSDCAFQPYCGADPVYHASRQGDPVGHRPTSDFCRKHTGLFEVLFGHLADQDPAVMRVFLAWITRRSVAEIPIAGFMV